MSDVISKYKETGVTDMDCPIGYNTDMLECLKLYQRKSSYQCTGFILFLLNERLNLSDRFFEICKKIWETRLVTL